MAKKPQSKTQKKIDNNVRKALTAACEDCLKDVPGFQWLTHQANYTNFPASLFVTCVFDTDEQLEVQLTADQGYWGFGSFLRAAGCCARPTCPSNRNTTGSPEASPSP